MLYQMLRSSVLLILLGPVLAACATGFEADVTRFHSLNQPNGETVTIQPAPGIEMGPEFTSYANLVGDRLAAEGYRPAASGPADIVATLGYAVRPTGAVEDEGPQVGIGMGTAGRHTAFGVGTGFSLSGGPKQVYMYDLSLVLSAADTGDHIFEGRAVARGTDTTLSPVMPELVAALFTDFPGVSGETRHVKLKPAQ